MAKPQAKKRIKTIKLSVKGKRYNADLDYTDLATKKKQTLTIYGTKIEEGEDITYRDNVVPVEVPKVRAKNGKMLELIREKDGKTEETYTKNGPQIELTRKADGSDDKGKKFKKGDKYKAPEYLKGETYDVPYKKGDTYKELEYKKGDKYISVEEKTEKIPVSTPTFKEVHTEVGSVTIYCKLMHFQVIELAKNYILNHTK